MLTNLKSLYDNHGLNIKTFKSGGGKAPTKLRKTTAVTVLDEIRMPPTVEMESRNSRYKTTSRGTAVGISPWQHLITPIN